MSESWYVLRTGLGEPSWNMALDEALLESAAGVGAPILRLYGWNKPAATFGYSQRYANVAAWTSLRPLIRRATGGGLVPHDADWTYSLIFPPNHPWCQVRAEESYRRVHDWISSSFQSLQVPARLSECCDKPAPGRCFIGTEKFDVLADGKKIAGAAQKRNKFGLLIQGSIQPPDVAQTNHLPPFTRATWEESLLNLGARDFVLTWTGLNLPESILNRAAALDHEKYRTESYNLRR